MCVEEEEVLEDWPEPKSPALNAQSNIYRDGLDERQVLRLEKTAERTGLRDEAAYLRLLLQEAHAEGDTNRVLKLMQVLARVEEADSRIVARRPLDSGEYYDNLLDFFRQRLIDAYSRNGVEAGPVRTGLPPVAEEESLSGLEESVLDADLDEAPAL